MSCFCLTVVLLIFHPCYHPFSILHLMISLLLYLRILILVSLILRIIIFKDAFRVIYCILQKTSSLLNHTRVEGCILNLIFFVSYCTPYSRNTEIGYFFKTLIHSTRSISIDDSSTFKGLLSSGSNSIHSRRDTMRYQRTRRIRTSDHSERVETNYQLS